MQVSRLCCVRGAAATGRARRGYVEDAVVGQARVVSGARGGAWGFAMGGGRAYRSPLGASGEAARGAEVLATRSAPAPP